MSNLLKQYYVANYNSKARIIDSNKRADNVIKERSAVEFKPISFNDDLEQENDEVVQDENFVQGIEAETIMEEDLTAVSMQAEEILNEARMQAEEIIAEANKKAKEILVSADIKAEHELEESKKRGYEEGAQEKLADVMKMQEEVESEIANRKKELEDEFQTKSDELESELIDAIITVFNKVFHIQFDDKKDMLLHLVKNTLMNVEVGKSFRIHVSKNNYKFITSHLDDIRLNIGNDVDIEVVNDANLGTEDCQIETNFGVFDCGIDMELNNLIKDIKSLCE